jgi:hypothetical protein
LGTIAGGGAAAALPTTAILRASVASKQQQQSALAGAHSDVASSTLAPSSIVDDANVTTSTTAGGGAYVVRRCLECLLYEEKLRVLQRDLVYALQRLQAAGGALDEADAHFLQLNTPPVRANGAPVAGASEGPDTEQHQQHEPRQPPQSVIVLPPGVASLSTPSAAALHHAADAQQQHQQQDFRREQLRVLAELDAVEASIMSDATARVRRQREEARSAADALIDRQSAQIAELEEEVTRLRIANDGLRTDQHVMRAMDVRTWERLKRMMTETAHEQARRIDEARARAVDRAERSGGAAAVQPAGTNASGLVDVSAMGASGYSPASTARTPSVLVTPDDAMSVLYPGSRALGTPSTGVASGTAPSTSAQRQQQSARAQQFAAAAARKQQLQLHAAPIGGPSQPAAYVSSDIPESWRPGGQRPRVDVALAATMPLAVHDRSDLTSRQPHYAAFTHAV